HASVRRVRDPAVLPGPARAQVISRRPHRSFAAYERLKLLLLRGKSGTIVSARATGRAGQLKKDGSTGLTRLRAPSGASSTRVVMVPRQPSTMPVPARTSARPPEPSKRSETAETPAVSPSAR